MYRIYSAPAGAENISPMEKERLLYKEAGTMDEAISWASHMSKTGHSVVLIDGDDGVAVRDQLLDLVGVHLAKPRGALQEEQHRETGQIAGRRRV